MSVATCHPAISNYWFAEMCLHNHNYESLFSYLPEISNYAVAEM